MFTIILLLNQTTIADEYQTNTLIGVYPPNVTKYLVLYLSREYDKYM